MSSQFWRDSLQNESNWQQERWWDKILTDIFENWVTNNLLICKSTGLDGCSLAKFIENGEEFTEILMNEVAVEIEKIDRPHSSPPVKSNQPFLIRHFQYLNIFIQYIHDRYRIPIFHHLQSTLLVVHCSDLSISKVIFINGVKTRWTLLQTNRNEKHIKEDMKSTMNWQVYWIVNKSPTNLQQMSHKMNLFECHNE